jgi:methionyl aminopeptidase
MSISSQADLKGMQRVARVVRLALDALETRLAPGVSTAELDAVAASVFRRHRARSAPALVYNFPGTVLISVNDEVVHGIPGARRIADGDLVKLDVTAELDGYVADAARTVAVGQVSDLGMCLKRCVEDAFAGALTVAHAGNRVNEVGRVVQREATSRGFAVVRGLDGHGVGRTIHEPPTVPNWYNPLQTDTLTEGLVLTIEPIIAAGSGRASTDADGWTIRTTDGSLAAHHEHTLVITRGAPLILTAA